MLTTIVIVAAALVLGLAANRLLRRRLPGEEAEALSMRDLVEPLQTLAVLVLAFVLVMAAESYSKAEDAARVEAAAVDNLYEVADYAGPQTRQQIQAHVVCYARAVLRSEWPSMVEGERSSAPSVWANSFRTDFKAMSQDPRFDMIVDADQKRHEGRYDRLAQSTPAIPGVIFWFMLITLAVTVIALAFTLPVKRRGTEITTLVILTALLTASLLIIYDVDRPFGGLVSISPTEMTITQQDIDHDYADTYGKSKLPCDAQGRQMA
ncbi:hypothetical protein [Streptomyces sp. NPDC059008]|uniref:bestrophin-like domain n=1 Tax=Streptomyces sp. NPDC059008 TaxID=3346693 RepID=UPI00369F95C1